MANWKYTIDIQSTWKQYKNYDHENYDNDPDLFTSMKGDITGAIKRQIKPGDYTKIRRIINGMETSKHLSSFNRLFSEMYDFLDAEKIWLKTSF